MGILEDSDFEREMICKDYRISIPGYNGFEKAEGALYFILSAIYVVLYNESQKFTEIPFEDRDEQGNLIRIEIHKENSIEPFVETWGFELKCNENEVKTTLFYRTFVPIKMRDNCDILAIKYMHHILTTVRDKIDDIIEALEYEDTREEVKMNKEYILNLLNNYLITTAGDICAIDKEETTNE